MTADSPGKYSVNIGQSSGSVVVGDHNVVYHTSAPSLATLGLPPPQAERINAALTALEQGRAGDNDDAKALKTAAAEPDATTRGQKIKLWLLKVAPHAAKLAGSIVNPVVGEIAKAATAWVARKLGNET